MTLEIVLMWAAVTAYAAGSVLLAVGTVFSKVMVRKVGVWASFAGVLPHIIATGIRWVRVGHPPFIGFYEVVSSLALIVVLFYSVIALRSKKLVLLGVVIMPFVFLATGAAMLVTKADFAMTATLASWWLAIHISFAKLSYGSFVISAGLAVLYLIRDRLDPAKYEKLLDLLPDQDALDDLTFRFVAVGFVFLGVMIASGAVWANEAWGRYWGWDPVESWSAISWFVYAAYLHLRLTMGWKGKRAAWLAIVALLLVVFSLVGVPIVYDSIHAAYIKGT